MARSKIWPPLEAFSHFVNAWVYIGIDEFYSYHGTKKKCIRAPSSSPSKAYFTSKPPEWVWDPARAIWLSPTGFIDPNEDPTTWYNEENAYNGNTSIFAIGNIKLPNGGTEAWGTFIWYTHTEMACKKVRIWCNIVSFTDVIDINAYFNDTWNLVYRGVFPYEEWFVRELVPPQLISAFRFRFHGTCYDWIEWINGLDCLIGEVEFYGYIL
ncbi:hypothetical protein ES705_16799 [subsurface metagenome]